MSGGSDVYSPGNIRYFRLGSILQTEGKLAVSSFLETYFPGKTLSDFLEETAVKSRLYSLWKKKKMKKEQFDKLYPIKGDVDLKTLDISLMFLLIRALHKAVASSDPVWTKPNPGNLSAEADVTRITGIRNRIWGHSDEVELSESDYLFEAKQLEMIITRLAKTLGNPLLDPFELEERINDKMSAKFEPHPSMQDVSTSTSSLQRSLEPFAIQSRGQNVYTRTPSLQRDSLETFDTQPTEQFDTQPTEQNVGPETTEILPCKINHRRSNERQSSNRSTSMNGSCVTLTCISKLHKRKYFHTEDHTDRHCRCLLAGVARLKNGVTVVTDTAHNSLMAYDKNNDLIGDMEFSSPHGVCAMSDDTVIVTLTKLSKIFIYRVDNVLHYVDDVDVTCDGWVYDVRFAHGCAYVLCDKGEIHFVNIDNRTEETLKIDVENINKIEYFDISSSGDRMFLSDGRGVVCIDDRGAELWKYRGGRAGLKTTGIVSVKNSVIVAVWEEDKLLELSQDGGQFMREIGLGHVQRPMALGTFGRHVFVTQYMSGLNEDVCRMVVTVRVQAREHCVII